eukprot:gene15981-20418_t
MPDALASFRLSRGSHSVQMARRQADEFRQFLSHLAESGHYGLRWSDLKLGGYTATLNGVARAMFYRSDFGESYGAEQIRRRSSAPRRLIKSRYIQNLVRVFDGPTIDLGCGAGQVLECLPTGSVGLEVNDTLIGYLKALRLDVLKYDALADDFALTPLSGHGPGRYHHLLS